MERIEAGGNESSWECGTEDWLEPIKAGMEVVAVKIKRKQRYCRSKVSRATLLIRCQGI